ncbi:MAG: winged helix DNA-binding domain-containing protein, partial [bacterium]|nr:winged helix DNA-binding domain-containing protein [bacterium]
NDGKQQTFVLLDDWAPNQRTLGRTEALVELAWRYFRSHGPTTVTDFAGWSGLTLTDSRAGAAANADRLRSVEYAGELLWMSSDIAQHLADGLPAQPTRALPGFDEFVLGYKDRRVQIAPEHFEAIVPGGNGVFRSTICIDGRAVATWTRTIRRDRVDVDVIPFEPFSKGRTAEASAALERYAQFLGLPLRLSFPR